MKKYIGFIGLFFFNAIHGQTSSNITDSLAMDSSIIYAPTEVGIPNGERSAKIIGKQGGSLASSDNRIELIFPEGAFNSKTQISIQPITNTSRDGIGNGYSIEPSGINFQQPVQLIFHYASKDVEGGSPALVGIASQDEKGVWYGLEKIKLDTVTKTISGLISHFSTWAMNWSYHLSPEKVRLKVSKKVRLFLFPTPIGEPEKGQRAEVILGIYGPKASNPRTWSVNAIPGGNSSFGTVDDALWPLLDRYVTYTAPAQVPAENPVSVTLTIEGAASGIAEGETRTLKRECKILVYDKAYEVKMISRMKGSSMQAWAGNMVYADEGSFVVSMEDETPKIIDIENNFERLLYNHCDVTILNSEENTGLIHIVDTRMIRLNPAQPPKKPYGTIEIEFTPRTAVFTTFKYNCPPPPGSRIKQNSVGTIPMLAYIPAFPLSASWQTKDGEQIIQQVGSESGPIYFKMTVKRLKD